MVVTLLPRKKIGPITATELLAASSEIYEAMKTYRDGQTDSQNKAGKGKGAIADTYRQIIIYETLCKLFESTRPEPNASVAEIYRNVKFHKILNALQHQVAVSTEKKKPVPVQWTKFIEFLYSYGFIREDGTFGLFSNAKMEIVKTDKAGDGLVSRGPHIMPGIFLHHAKFLIVKVIPIWSKPIAQSGKSMAYSWGRSSDKVQIQPQLLVATSPDQYYKGCYANSGKNPDDPTAPGKRNNNTQIAWALCCLPFWFVEGRLRTERKVYLANAHMDLVLECTDPISPGDEVLAEYYPSTWDPSHEKTATKGFDLDPLMNHLTEKLPTHEHCYYILETDLIANYWMADYLYNAKIRLNGELVCIRTTFPQILVTRYKKRPHYELVEPIEDNGTCSTVSKRPAVEQEHESSGKRQKTDESK
jgi:hypothetical protein